MSRADDDQLKVQLTRQAEPRDHLATPFSAIAELLADAEHPKVSSVVIVSRYGTVVVAPDGQTHGHCRQDEAHDPQTCHAHRV